VILAAHRLQPPGDTPDEGHTTPSPYGEFPDPREDLPYKVEVCDASGETIELLVAATVSPALGYAAYYAASREYPGRTIVLRHKGAVISRWAGQEH
jgi:hypothetical protein